MGLDPLDTAGQPLSLEWVFSLEPPAGNGILTRHRRDGTPRPGLRSAG